MKKKLLKLFTIASVSLVALISLKELARACCAFSADTDSSYYSLYAPQLMGPTRLFPFFYAVSSVYYSSPIDSMPKDTTDQYLSNTKAWKNYMKGVPAEAEIDRFIYKMKTASVRKLVDLIGAGKTEGPDSVFSNEAARYLATTKDLEAAKYVLFAKQCEPFANTGFEPWSPLPAKDTVKMKGLIESGRKACAQSHNDFIRFRYAFQVVRLAHYSGQYQLCLDLYAQLMEGKNENSIVSLWGIALKGGALTRLKKGDQAAYIFAMLFDRHFNYNWETYRQNFEWASGNGIAYCKSNHERAVVYALQSLHDQNVLGNMGHVLDEEPGSEYLELMLTRHINQLERELLPPKDTWKRDEEYRNEKVSAAAAAKRAKDAEETRIFILKALQKGGLKHPALWEFSAGYMSYLLQDFESTKRYFDLALAHAPGNRMMQDHIYAISVLQKIDHAAKLDKAFEALMFADVNKLYSMRRPGSPSEDALLLVFDNMSSRYLAQGDTLRAMLCAAGSPAPPDLTSRPDMYTLDRLIGFMSRNGKTSFETMLETTFTSKYSLEALHEIKGTAFLARYKFKDAIGEFQFATGNLKALIADPFLIHVCDCHDCDYALNNGKLKMNKLDLAKRLAELEVAANTTSSDQAKACFDLGNACYNLTAFGNNWSAARYNYTPGWIDLGDAKDPDPYYDDCAKALGYYNKGMELAKDKELAAKCCFMASKCEQNYFYTGEDYGVDDRAIAIKNSKYHTFFKIMKDSYANTRFYEQAIKECGYFAKYTSN